MPIQRRLVAVVTGVALLAGVSACSRLKSYFPDKEKEYRYSTELPPLVIPPDLSAVAIEDPAVAPAIGADITNMQPPSGAERMNEKDKAEPPAEEEPIVVESRGALHVREPFDRAWRLVDRALGRQSLEVVDRDRSRGVFYVIYEEIREGAPKEGSIWAEILYVFGKEASKETEYRVMLEEIESGMTEVTILDNKGRREIQGTALDLLRLIREGIESNS